MEFNIPLWAQQLTVFGVTIVSVFIGIWRYVKTQTDSVHKKHTPDPHDTITAAAFVDSKLIKELIDTLREHSEEIGRQSQRVTRSQGELRETIIELIEGIHVQNNSTMNLLRFMKRPPGGEI